MITKIENYEEIECCKHYRTALNTMLLSLMTYQTSWLKYIDIK